jgi:DNA-binding response OmpR family regulator
VAFILSAEDDPDIRQLIERVLVAAGHRVVLAADGRSALDAAFDDDLDFDLVILDADLPRMRGLDACRVLRDDPRTGHLPVIIVSGSPATPYDEVLAAGATAYMCKPFAPAELRDAVEGELSTAAVTLH